MDAHAPNRQPGDLILDRYMPQATADEREAARANLRAFAVVVVSIAKRLALEDLDQATRANGPRAVDLEERQSPHP